MKRNFKSCLMAACAVMLSASVLTSCGSGASGSKSGDTIYSSKMTDSISSYLGEALGWQCLESTLTSNDSIDRDQLIKGLRYMLEADTTTGFNQGMKIGMQLKMQFEDFAKRGLYINRDLFIKEFENYFKKSELDMNRYKAATATSDSLFGAMTEIYNKKQSDKRAASPEAAENLKKGEAFIAELKDSIPTLGQLENGGYILILDPGSGEKYNESTTYVNMIFNETSLSGTPVQSTQGQAYPIDITSDQIPAYIREAVMQVAPGGKMKLFVPGQYAYGALGVDGRVGPNELIIYDIILER